MKKCRYCGYETYNDDTYCKKCGRLIVDSSLLKEEEIVYEGEMIEEKEDKKPSFSLYGLALIAAIFYLIAFFALKYNIVNPTYNYIKELVSFILYVVSFILSIISLCLDFALFKKCEHKILPILGIIISFIIVALHLYMVGINILEYISKLGK